MASKSLNIEWTYHGEFFKVALDHFRFIQRLREDHDVFRSDLNEKTKEMSEADVDVLAEMGNEIGGHALVVVMFCAFTLEAYINHYGNSRLSKNYFANYLDKLGLDAKWLVVPKMVTGKELDPGSHAIQDLSWLVALRNKLAHYK